MTHYRYTKKNGKIYGPYVYENSRVNGKVVSHYVGKSSSAKNLFGGLNYNVLIAVSILLVVLLAILVVNKGITGNVILESDDVNQNYILGENISGHFSFVIESGLIGSSVLNVNLGGQTREINVADFANSSSSLIYPDVDFN